MINFIKKAGKIFTSLLSSPVDAETEKGKKIEQTIKEANEEIKKVSKEDTPVVEDKDTENTTTASTQESTSLVPVEKEAANSSSTAVVSTKEEKVKQIIKTAREKVNSIWQDLPEIIFTHFEITPNGSLVLKGTAYPLTSNFKAYLSKHIKTEKEVKAFASMWLALLGNQDKRAIDYLGAYISKNKINISELGYLELYKSMQYKKKDSNSYINLEYSKEEIQLISDSGVIDKIKKAKKGLKSCFIYITEEKEVKYTNKQLNSDIKYISANEFLTLFKGTEEEKEEYYFSPHHSGGTHGLQVELGKAVKMPRNLCNSNPSASCSTGLHVASIDFLHHNYSKGTWLKVLVNPANIVCIPHGEPGKIRCCEYYPLHVITKDYKPTGEIFKDIDYLKQEIEDDKAKGKVSKDKMSEYELNRMKLIESILINR